MRRPVAVLTFALSCVALAGCARSPQSGAPLASATVATRAPALVSAAPEPVDASLPRVLVHKSSSCGCCGAWVAHMRKAGFAVDVDDTDDIEPIKKRLGVPAGKGSCHTAEVAGLVIEGHVPADDIKRLLAARDGARGLVAPGMPAGSPGMETPDGRTPRYTVEKINADGSTTPFATHGAQ